MYKIKREFKVYSLDELCDGAKRRAYNDWYKSHYTDMPWCDYYYDKSLDRFEQLCDITVDYNGIGYRPSYSVKPNDSLWNAWNIEGYNRLYRWVVNNWYDKFVTHKFYCKYNGNAEHTSKVLVRHNVGVLTGMSGYDYALENTMDDFLTGKTKYNTLRDLLYACVAKHIEVWEEDRLYEFSYEYFLDCTQEAEEALYYADGEYWGDYYDLEEGDTECA